MIVNVMHDIIKNDDVRPRAGTTRLMEALARSLPPKVPRSLRFWKASARRNDCGKCRSKGFSKEEELAVDTFSA